MWPSGKISKHLQSSFYSFISKAKYTTLAPQEKANNEISIHVVDHILAYSTSILQQKVLLLQAEMELQEGKLMEFVPSFP
jgi:hypothetical protein